MILPLIPAPAVVELGEGELGLSGLVGLTAADPEALTVVEQFRSDLALWAGVDLPAARNARCPGVGQLHAALTTTMASDDEHIPGAYSLVIDRDRITVTAAEAVGLHHGLGSLVQLIGAGGPVLPCLRVTDRPAFGWRGLSLDVARHFQPVETVKRVIDLLALYKFSTLHLHLTDNEGWRLQILSRPRLTGEGPFYTQDEYAELVAYAAARFVTVVPEIDLPGHCGAALRAYPELSADGLPPREGPFPVANLDGPPDTVWAFVEDVLTELVALTPGPHVHVGGDEAFGMDHSAHAEFVGRAMRLVAGLGKSPVGWQEASRGDLVPGQIVQHWIDFRADAPDSAESRPPEAATTAVSRIDPETLARLSDNFLRASADLGRIDRQGARLLLSPTRRAYLDRPHADDSADPSQAGLRARLGLPYYPPSRVRDYVEWDPVAEAGPIARPRIVGVEAAVWAETITGSDDLELLLLPRLPGTAEVGWAEPGPREWEEFRVRLVRHAAMWSRAGWNWYRADTLDWKEGGVAG